MLTNQNIINDSSIELMSDLNKEYYTQYFEYNLKQHISESIYELWLMLDNR